MSRRSASPWAASCARRSPPFFRVSHAGDEVVHDGVVEAGRRDHDSFLGEVRDSAGMLPGSRPPTSEWCARDVAELRPGDERDVGQMGAAGVRVVENEDVVP